MHILAIILSCLQAASAPADADRWVTFKAGHNSQGPIAHQIDRQSVRQDGPYRIFWTRIWMLKEHQPLVFSENEALYFWSQKYLVDCSHRRFGSRFVDSNQPREMRRKATLQTMVWEPLEKVPAVERVVCERR